MIHSFFNYRFKHTCKHVCKHACTLKCKQTSEQVSKQACKHICKHACTSFIGQRRRKVGWTDACTDARHFLRCSSQQNI